MKSPLKLTAATAITLMIMMSLHSAQAAMVARTIDYQLDGKPMQSVLVYDDSSKKLRPGLVMTPDWLGMNANQVALAKQVAGRTM